MSTLFNTLIAKVVADADGKTHTEFYTPAGNLHSTIPAGDTQPRFGKQRYVMLNGTYYGLIWNLTPSTPQVA